MRTRRDGSSRPRRYRAVQPWVVVWLSLVWLALWGAVTPLLVVSAPVVAVLVCLVFPLPPLRLGARVRWGALLVLLGRFAVDVVRASVQVAWVTLRQAPRRPGVPLRNALVRVDLASESDVVLTATVVMLSLVPGSVLVEARRSTHTLFLHVLDVHDDAGVERFRATVLEQEQRILAAFEPRADAPDPRRPEGAAA